MADKLYDVAISFLARDEGVAAQINAGLVDAGLNVFFFPRKQEELAGTNGLESMRTPFLETRVVVVLYREPWGETNWTRVEQTAITDRCLKQGWTSLLFVVLDKSSRLPKWLPETYVRFSLETYGVEQAVGAIKLRVQEMGGLVEKPSPVVVAKRIKEEAELRADQDRLFRDQTWVQRTAKQSVEALMQSLMMEAEKLNAEAGLQINFGYEPHYAGFRAVMRYGRVTLEVLWNQHYVNVIDEVLLECREYNALVPLQRERRMMFREPDTIRVKTYKPVLNLARELKWSEAEKPSQMLSNEEVIRRIVEQFLDLIDRLNRGKISRPDWP
jgi:hypothetical protein